jgi:hypothetical protein
VKRSVFAAAVAVVLGAGCGGSKSLSDEASVRAVADAFAHTVDPEANPAKLCALLLGEARRNQGCGTEGEDIGPLLQLAIDSERDVRVVKIQGDEAVAEIPSIPIGPGHPKGAGPPQVLQLHKFDGQWRFTRLELSEPQTASRSARAVAFTRDCGSRVEDGTLRPNRRRDVIAGPLVLYGLREAARAPASSFRGRYGRHQPWKAVTEVAHGSDVLVQIQQRYRGRVSLLYRFPGGDRSGYRLSDGDLAVRFKPCPLSKPRRLGRGTVGSRTQFNGGFVVAGPQCVELRVAVAGRPREIHRRVSFGTSSACESGAGHRSRNHASRTEIEPRSSRKRSTLDSPTARREARRDQQASRTVRDHCWLRAPRWLDQREVAVVGDQVRRTPLDSDRQEAGLLAATDLGAHQGETHAALLGVCPSLPKSGVLARDRTSREG